MILNIILLVIGFVILIKGAGWFVDGASSLALNFHVSKILIGLTIVAFGSGAPEFAISIKSILLIIIGIILIILGSNFVVDGATLIAHQAGIIQRLISLTVVAFGTSLPELVTSVTASIKGEYDIAIGNIVGSNIFNIGVVLGLPVMLFGSIGAVNFNYLYILL